MTSCTQNLMDNRLFLYIIGIALFCLLLRLQYINNWSFEQISDQKMGIFTVRDNEKVGFVGLVNIFNFRNIPPYKLNRWQPIGRCSNDLAAYLKKLQETQKERVNYWYNASVESTMKWVSLLYVYAPELIAYSSLYRFKSDGELKYFSDFVKPPTSCNFWTLGVGLDYRGEARLHLRYPQCNFTAVDPLTEVNKHLVEAVPNARFIEGTIGAEDGNFKAHLSNAHHRYSTKTTRHTSIGNFFQKHNGNRTIDLLLMDIEGAEFGILPKLIDNFQHLPTICQINVELHHPPEKYGLTTEEAFNNMYKFINDGTYTVFNMEVFRRFFRIYVVNTRSEECVKKFFC